MLKQVQLATQDPGSLIRIFRACIQTTFFAYPKIFVSNSHQSGFTYLGLLILLAILGISSAASLHIGLIMERRSAEKELLDIGREYRNALISYSISSPIGTDRYPRRLEDLLLDPRYSQKKRHLRRIYVDPISGSHTWGIIYHPNGSGVIGIHSLSTDTPIKIGGFDEEFNQFTGKPTYRHWVFSVEN